MKKYLLLAGLLAATLTLLTPTWVQAQGGSYTVQPGDTLYAIAGRYGVNVDQLAQANGLTQNSWIQQGQQLVIPLGPPASSQWAGPPQWSAQPNYPASDFGDPYAPVNNGFGSLAYQPVIQNPPQPYAAPSNAPMPGYNQFDPYQAGPTAYPQPPANQPFSNQAAAYPYQSAYQPAAFNPYGGQPTFAPQPRPEIFNAYSLGQPPVAPSPGPATANGEKWIDINLSSQTLTAFEGQTPVFRAIISTGAYPFPTVAGTYEIYVKYEKTDMSGGTGPDAYYVKDVPYVMYFHGGYGIHGTYWHDNFGMPMSHGCVNLTIPDSQWLYTWAQVGTTVVTHY